MNGVALEMRKCIHEIHPGGYKSFERVLEGAGLNAEEVFRKAAGAYTSLTCVDSAQATKTSAARFGSAACKMGSKADRAESLTAVLSVLPKAVAESLGAEWFHVVAAAVPIAGKQNQRGSFVATKKRWTRQEAVRVFEILLEKGNTLFSSSGFRGKLSRDENLLANQFTREANGNIAYRSVDFGITDEMSDEVFWSRIEKTPYNDLIEDNAAMAIVKMAEKLKLLE